jgi:preprotein translocase subunit SecG
MLYQVLIVVYLLVALLLIGFVLIQQGKGADMGASFGSGGSNTVFGSSGSGNFMTKSTAILATGFFVISLVLGSMTAKKEKSVDEWENLEVPATQSKPVTIEPLPASEDVPVVETTSESQDESGSDVPN